MKNSCTLPVLLAGLFTSWFLGVANAETKQPNILFVFSDDHALQAIGAYGSTINQTPNLDRIATEGGISEFVLCQFDLWALTRLHPDGQAFSQERVPR